MSVTNNFTLHDNMSHKTGAYLELAVGPMFSSKTSFLVELYKQYTLDILQDKVSVDLIKYCIHNYF